MGLRCFQVIQTEAGMLTIDGVTRTLQQWCRQYGVDHSKVRYRLSIGMSPIEALTAGDLRIGNPKG